MADKYSKLKVKELQGRAPQCVHHYINIHVCMYAFGDILIYSVKTRLELLQKHGLPHSGKKDELIDRLVKHDDKKMDDLALEEELGNLEEFDEAKLE
jgi:hypothetical protein